MKKSHVATATLTKTVGLVALASALAFPAAAFANTSPKGGGLPDKNSLEQRVEQAVLQAQQQERKIDKAAIERVAFEAWKYQRAYLHSLSILYDRHMREVKNPRIQRGRIYFTERKKLLFTPITVDEHGNFSVRITGEDAKGREQSSTNSLWGKYVRGTRRADGYYVVSTINDAGHRMTHLRDINGQVVNEQIIKQQLQRSLKKELDKIKDFGDMKKDMIAAILAGNGVYEIDHIKEGKRHTIYADTLNSNIEIRFVKKDAKTVYGVYIVSKNDTRRVKETNHGSEIYAFKYSDESTTNKQRIHLMTKRVVQYDFDEENPTTKKYTTGSKRNEYKECQTFTSGAGIFFRRGTQISSCKLDSIYEEFMCEGVIHTTYTQDYGLFYKNQQRMF